MKKKKKTDGNPLVSNIFGFLDHLKHNTYLRLGHEEGDLIELISRCFFHGGW